ncbi:MOSC domain-containing protein [Brevibacterium sp. LS14]|uniref:Aromatic ring-opening dioxygenase LigA n=1 Tax=Brevibacterium casei TaxID=33889 RepID=A0AB34XWM8_9MICO|nr:aromatic ring-opening dioxygenase LigA [Brevibacterium casei]NJE67688.1 MOSC domain-containing protein [Brevibacterium sp. LS14]QZE25684.1 MOSC domain-containing protein [Brevibacterium casei]
MEWEGGAEVDDDVLDVRAVGFSPIKGTRHLVQPQARFDAAGPLGDRRFCLVDMRTRRVLRTVQNPSLLAVVARMQGEALETVLPDGTAVTAVPEPTGETLTCDYWGRAVDLTFTDGDHDELFSTHLGRPVRLAEAPRGGVVFGQPLTIVATASLAEVAGGAAVTDLFHRFRATLLVDTNEPFAEETWLGRVMTVRGTGAVGGLRVRIGGPVPRCAVIDLDPTTGERTGSLLTTLAATRATNRAGEPFFGVYAEVV